MNLDEALAIIRGSLDDEIVSYLWSNANLISYLNRRINEFARKTEHYQDHTTTAICNIAVTAGTATYALDSRVISIKRARGSWDSSKLPLTRRTVSYMDAKHPGWENDSADEPLYYIPDRTAGYITIHPNPSSNGTLYLDVTRLPLAQLTLSDIGKATPTEIEFPLMWVENLFDGVLASAFSKPDSQTRNPQMAQYHLGLWNAFLQEAGLHNETERVDRAFIDSNSFEDDGVFVFEG